MTSDRNAILTLLLVLGYLVWGYGWCHPLVTNASGPFPVSEMTYIMSSGTLNPTIPYYLDHHQQLSSTWALGIGHSHVMHWWLCLISMAMLLLHCGRREEGTDRDQVWVWTHICVVGQHWLLMCHYFLTAIHTDNTDQTIMTRHTGELLSCCIRQILLEVCQHFEFEFTLPKSLSSW